MWSIRWARKQRAEAYPGDSGLPRPSRARAALTVSRGGGAWPVRCASSADAHSMPRTRWPGQPDRDAERQTFLKLVYILIRRAAKVSAAAVRGVRSSTRAGSPALSDDVRFGLRSVRNVGDDIIEARKASPPHRRAAPPTRGERDNGLRLRALDDRRHRLSLAEAGGRAAGEAAGGAAGFGDREQHVVHGGRDGLGVGTPAGDGLVAGLIGVVPNERGGRLARRRRRPSSVWGPARSGSPRRVRCPPRH